MEIFRKSIAFYLLLSLAMFFTACSDDDSETPTTNPSPSGSSGTLPSSVKGQVVNMKFTAPQAGAPYSLDQEVTFTFSSSGMLFIDENPAAKDGDEITISSFTKEGNEFVWKESSKDHSYALSLKADSSINEVNLSQTSTATFLGQFVPIASSSGGAALVAELEGSYTVSSVDKGSHSRMSLSIDANGNIDFDSNVALNASDFALVSDKKTCCNAIYVDMKPYPTEPYQRVNLLLNASGDLEKIEYMPKYPQITDRVHVSLSKSGGSTGNNSLSVSGDVSKVGGATFAPAIGLECTSCSSSEKYTWTENVSGGPNKVFSIEIFSNGTVVLDFSAGSAFAATASSLAGLGIVHDSTAKTFQISNTTMNEKFSQSGVITINGTLRYQ
jgi:hypothetical protein